MNVLKRDPRVVIFSIWVYRLLLLAYPIDFQHAYAACMAQVFRDCSLRAYHTRGLLGMLSLWKLTLVDYIKSAFEEYTSIIHLNPSRFILFSGWAFILGTSTFLSGFFINLMISDHGNPYESYNFFSRPVDQFFFCSTEYPGTRSNGPAYPGCDRSPFEIWATGRPIDQDWISGRYSRRDPHLYILFG